MAECIPAIKGDSTQLDELAPLMFNVLNVKITGTVRYTGGEQSIGPVYNIGFRPSFWLLPYETSQTDRMFIIPYTTTKQPCFGSIYSQGFDVYMTVNGSTCSFTIRPYGYENAGTMEYSRTVKAIFFR